MAITKRQFIKYTVLPGFLPRLVHLFGHGFSYLACYMAVLYSNVGLIAKDHPYLQPANFGRYGVRHVIAQASRNLDYSWKNADKVVVFYLLLAGIAILSLQFLVIILSFVSQPVFATSLSFFRVFNLTDATGTAIDISRYRQDMAFVVLDRALGLRMSPTSPDTFFLSCVGNTTVDCENIRGEVIGMPTIPTPFHRALHNIFNFYSVGILTLGVIMILYCVIAIVGETVTSGTPFGKRFSRAWFVPRLILFFAMITPLGMQSNLTFIAANGVKLNSAQYVVLGTAKFGSNMATNAWDRFSSTLLLADTMIAKPNAPSLSEMTQFMYIARMCMMAEMLLHNKLVLPYIVKELSLGVMSLSASGIPINVLPYSSTTFREAVEFSNYGTVTVRFGELNLPDWMDPVVPGAHLTHSGFVEPTCGELVFNIESIDPHVIGGSGILGIQEVYYNFIEDYMFSSPYVDESAYCVLSAVLPYNHKPECVSNNLNTPATGTPTGTHWPTYQGLSESVGFFDMEGRRLITGDYINPSTGAYTNNPTGTIMAALRTVYDGPTLPPEIRERGWAAAALWYNRIAEINGMMVGAIHNTPVTTKYPMIMEEIASQHQSYDSAYSSTDRFNPLLQNGKLATLERQGDQYLAAAYYAGYNLWDIASPHITPDTKRSGNAVIDIVNMIFGTQGLIDIRENNGTHPLAMLSALGRGMVQASLDSLVKGVGASGIAIILSEYFPGESQLAESAGGLFLKIAMIGLSIGFVLYYVVPLMPFIYFFFAFGGWVKSIFEALVAMPLWALAHIKIDGEGLPGPFAMNGYFLLFEILLRPILIIAGFVASIVFFSALVDVLHTGFSKYILNVGGANHEKILFAPATNPISMLMGPIDEFFYTVMYTILVYMIGVSCFKLIDNIPNQIMRWMGVTVSTFQEKAGDPASELQGRMFRASQTTSSQLDAMINRTSQGLTNTQLATQLATK